MEPQEPIPPRENEPERVEPLAPPIPSRGTNWVWGSGVGLTALATVGGALILLGVAGSNRTMGATRSVRLKWEQNQREAAAAVDADRDSAASTQPASGR
jgi:hypothetical protein